MLQNPAFGFGFEIWKSGRSGESGEGKESLYMGDMTPVFAIDHFRFREASQRTTRELEEEPVWPGSEAEALPGFPARGGNIFATQRSP
jgi:hypothetical protein